MTQRDYSRFSKEELLKILEKVESRKKYGLIWDEDKVKEQFEKDAENALPVLKEVKEKEITDKDDTKPVNILIEGDNYHALSVLNFTHQGKVDVIYIDPPYNTGNNDFIYNDKYVDKEDGFRHSKWLSFMEKRLKLSFFLLKETGAIFISIDDNEQATLKMLCDEIFGEQNFVAQMVWQKIHSTKNDAKFFSQNHEYIICYAKDINCLRVNLLSRTEGMNARYLNPDKDPRGPWQSGDLVANEERTNGNYKIKGPTGKVFQVLKGKHWVYSEENLLEMIADNRIWFGVKGDAFPRKKRFLSEVQQGKKADTLWLSEDVGHNQEGKRELKDFFEQSDELFSTPKPTRLIKRVIQLVGDKNTIVLDFMAGSGTTGQAVLTLNKEDGGNRSFILCTNNGDEKSEHKIASDICYPRIKKVINGHKETKGTGGTLKYFKTKFIKKTANKDDLKIRITKECTEMLCLREGIFDEIKTTDDYCIFQKGNKILAAYYSLDRKTLSELKKELNKLEGDKTFYCFTLDPLGLNKKDFSGWKDATVEPIPQKILDVYKQIYEY
jgi:adenine-specific DNA-methyltransferase